MAPEAVRRSEATHPSAPQRRHDAALGLRGPCALGVAGICPLRRSALRGLTQVAILDANVPYFKGPSAEPVHEDNDAVAGEHPGDLSEVLVDTGKSGEDCMVRDGGLQFGRCGRLLEVNVKALSELGVVYDAHLE